MGQRTSIIAFKEYILDCNFKLEQNVLEEKEITMIKDVVSLLDDYQSSVFYLKVCMKFGKEQEAVKFANSQFHNEKFTKQEQAKMKTMKEKIIQIMKQNKAIEVLESGKGVQVAMQRSGLPETIVIQLNNQLQRAQRNREKDDADEPHIEE